MRCTPSASTTERIAGSPSGTAATASDTPSSSTRVTSPALRMSDSANSVRHHHDGDDDDRDAEHAADARDLLAAAASAPRRWLRASRRSRPSRCPSPVAVTTARPRALRDRRALEDHVEPVAERRRPRQRRGVLQHRLALACQRGFLHAQRRGLDQPRVGADGVALAEHQQVAAHQLGAGHAQRHAVAQHRPRWPRSSAPARPRRSRPWPPARSPSAPLSDDDGRDDDRIHRPADARLRSPRRRARWRSPPSSR